MTKTLKQAKQFVRKGIEKLNTGDKYIIGMALLEGREENKSDPAFGKWRRDNGFGDLSRDDIREYMWLATNGHMDFYSQGYPSIRKAMQAWMELNPPELSKTEIVLNAFEKGEKLKAIEVSNRTGLSKEDAGKILASLAESGRLSKPERGVYCQASGVEKPEKQPSGLNWMKDGHAFGRVFDLVKKYIRAGYVENFPKSSDPHENGTYVQQLIPENQGENWVDAANANGIANGYRIRIVVDKVKVKVDGDSISLTGKKW